jgi:cation transport ATPase
MLAAAVVVLLATGDLQRSIALLIVACPCALLLATPSAVLAAIGAGARRGILVRGGEYLEACARLDTVVFDKTGTLTLGDLYVAKVVPLCGRTVEEVIGPAAVAEAGSEHPVARAVLDAAREKGLTADAAEMRLHPEGGIEARSEGTASSWGVRDSSIWPGSPCRMRPRMSGIPLRLPASHRSSWEWEKRSSA